ncbi:MAG: tetratricopeptide repeat protein [Gammaproteobacteria bacterium]
MKRWSFYLVGLIAGLALSSGMLKANELDDALAAYNKGNFEKAVELWLAIAEKGDSTAEYSLGQMYEQGKGVEQDYQEAFKWYRLSAEQGNARAQYNLGGMYEKGQGVSRDYIRAYMWYDLAAIQGLHVARSNRDYIAQRMSPGQINEAQNLRRECEKSNFKDCY